MDPLTWWDTLKHKIKKKFIEIGIQNKKRLNEKPKNLEQEISTLRKQQPINQEKIYKIDHELREIERTKIRGAEIRARTDELVNLDKPTDFLYALEKIRAKSQNVTKILDEQGNLKESKQEIVETITSFYKKLYTSTNPKQEDIENTTNILKTRQ